MDPVGARPIISSPPKAEPQPFALSANADGTFTVRGAPLSIVRAYNQRPMVLHGSSPDNDAVMIGATDANGVFTGKLPDTLAGDCIFVRLGESPQWQQIVTAGTVTTAGIFNTALMTAYEDRTRGDAVATGAYPDHPVGEPGMRLHWINKSRPSAPVADVTLDAFGQLPPDFRLSAHMGDVFDVSTEFAGLSYVVENGVQVIGHEAHDADIADPQVSLAYQDRNGTPVVGTRHFSGPLFGRGIAATDVFQGTLSDCATAATYSAVAALDPKAIADMVRADADGTYSVRFYEKTTHWFGMTTYAAHWVKVDSDLYVKNGQPIFAKSINADDPKKMKLWWPLIEKALAQWRGSYAAIDSGRATEEIFSEIYGRGSPTTVAVNNDADALWLAVSGQTDDRQPRVLSTYDAKDRSFAGSGLVPAHGYAVLMAYTHPVTKQRMLVLRNPWGSYEPKGDKHDDGRFQIPVETAAVYFRDVTIAGK